MRSAVDRVNRVVLTIVFAAVAAAAVVAFGASWGWWEALGLGPVAAPPEAVRRAVAGLEAPAMLTGAILAGVGLVLVVLGLAWVAAQFRRGSRRGPDEVTLDARDGTTAVTSAALSRAYAAELRSLPGVRGTRVRSVRGADGGLSWDGRAELDADADTAAVRDGADAALARLGRCVGRDDVSGSLSLRPTRDRARVR